jgi:PAT family beta-lactamase induction signal transducer AmpG
MTTSHLSPKRSWAQTLKVYLEPPTLRMLLLGFSAGLPLLLVLGTLSFRLREAGIDRTTIGFLSWVGLAYGFKWVWSPLVDRMPIPLLTPWLGRRRSWLLLSQIVIIAGLVGMAVTNPQNDLQSMVWFAVAVAFGSATQDIALDAYRIESADVDRQAAMASAYMTGYRIAMIWAGAGVFWVAAFAEDAPAAQIAGAVAAEAAKVVYQHSAWQTAYLVMAASMLLGVITVFWSPKSIESVGNLLDESNSKRLLTHFKEIGVPVYGVFLALTLVSLIVYGVYSQLITAAFFMLFYFFPVVILYLILLTALIISKQRIQLPNSVLPFCVWFTKAFFEPFADFIRRYKWQAALILALIATYRISDVVMGIMANPFYVDMGYTKLEVANVTKVFGVIMTLVGAFIGGVLSMRFGVMRILMLGAILSAVSNLLFAWLGGRGHDLDALIWVISADNLSSGIASAAFIAYLSSLTNINYSATQYALFSSMMLLFPKFLAGYSGKYVDAFGYVDFFTATAMLGMPVLLLVWLASRIKTPKKAI